MVRKQFWCAIMMSIVFGACGIESTDPNERDILSALLDNDSSSEDFVVRITDENGNAVKEYYDACSFYQDANRGGWKIELTEAVGMSYLFDRNDKISSTEIRSEGTPTAATIGTDNYFRGSVAIFEDSCKNSISASCVDLHNSVMWYYNHNVGTFNDSASSLECVGPYHWSNAFGTTTRNADCRLYQDANLGGHLLGLAMKNGVVGTRATIPNLVTGFWGDRISSVFVKYGYLVNMWVNAIGTGSAGVASLDCSRGRDNCLTTNSKGRRFPINYTDTGAWINLSYGGFDDMTSAVSCIRQSLQ